MAGAGVLGTIVLLSVMVALVARPGSGPGGRAPIFGGPSNHAELADELRKRGYTVEVRPTALGDTATRTTADFHTKKADLKGTVVVFLYQTRDQAKDGVGAMHDGFQYGRFAIGVLRPMPENEAVVKSLREALR